MNRYQNNDGHIIVATDKAYKVLYEQQGYALVKEKKVKTSTKRVVKDGTN